MGLEWTSLKGTDRCFNLNIVMSSFMLIWHLIRGLSNIVFWPALIYLKHDKSEAREWGHDSDKTQANKLEWWMSFEDFSKGKSRYP